MHRRGLTRVLGAALAAGVMALAGCAQLPAGADGDLVNGWPQIAAPKGWSPEAGTCHEDYSESVQRTEYKPVACTSRHSYETAYLGTFSGAGAERTSPPTAGSAELAAAWSECDKKVTEYVGGEWRTGKFRIAVTVPSSGAWGGGVRWFRCEVATNSGTSTAAVSRTASVKGALASEPGLKYGCFQYDNKVRTEIDCGQPHNAEFVGIYTSNVAYSQLSTLDEQIAAECRAIIANFVGLPGDKNMKYRTGVVWSYPNQSDWEAGDHGVRCHLWVKRQNSRSLAGTGNGGLPINYA
jgi:hypothetical protein